MVSVLGWQRRRFARRPAKLLLALLGVDFPASVEYGENLRIEHRGHGIVINPNTRIGDHVTIYHNVTIARADSWVPEGDRRFHPTVVEDDAVICPGAVILSAQEGLVVGRGTIIGANSTLTHSTGQWEIWAGSPAKKIAERTVATDLVSLASTKKGMTVPVAGDVSQNRQA